MRVEPSDAVALRADQIGAPAFDAIRPWFLRLREPSLAALNELSAALGIVTQSGQAVRFVPPAPSDPYYEIKVYETGRVSTRTDRPHDLLNALVWLAFPLSKARINALHAAAIPAEGGKRGPLRDLLTIFDEGGAIQSPGRVTIFGHATMEQALAPWPGMTCKVLSVDADADLDAQVAARLADFWPHGNPRLLPTRPVFREQGWLPGYTAGQGAGQAAAAPPGAEESPGSTERDAG